MKRAGKDVPALDRRPVIIGYEWLWEGFHDLSTCRAGGMGLMPIPWLATQRYAEVMGLDADETFLLHTVVRAMDSKYREHAHKQTQK